MGMNQVWEVFPYDSRLRSDWDLFLKRENYFTFQHTRSFFEFYKRKINDRSLMVFEKTGDICALFPLNMTSSNSLESFSTSSYGGPIFSGKLRIEQRINLWNILIEYLRARRTSGQLSIRMPPSFLQKETSEFTEWMLWSSGFDVTSVFLHAHVDLNSKINLQRDRINSQKSALFQISETSYAGEVVKLWEIINDNLRIRFNTAPVHTSQDLLSLQKLFCEHIRIFVGKHNGEIAGGLVFFNTIDGFHLQYMATNDFGRKNSLGDALILEAIEVARGEGFSSFSFGHSNENNGKLLNLGLHAFKSKFGSQVFSSKTWKISW